SSTPGRHSARRPPTASCTDRAIGITRTRPATARSAPWSPSDLGGAARTCATIAGVASRRKGPTDQRSLYSPVAPSSFPAHSPLASPPAIRHLTPMADDDIPFNRTLALAPGTVEEIAPGVRRLLCNNPSPFTFKGTMSYIVGRGEVAIIDPGPDDEDHIAALLDAVRGETVNHIIVTHTHRDHSPGAAGGKAATAPRGRCISARRRGST